LWSCEHQRKSSEERQAGIKGAKVARIQERKVARGDGPPLRKFEGGGGQGEWLKRPMEGGGGKDHSPTPRFGTIQKGDGFLESRRGLGTVSPGGEMEVEPWRRFLPCTG